MKISFESDYCNGAHPAVLNRLVATNDEPSGTYGSDRWSERAREKIRHATGCSQARVEFLAGGTQTNATILDAILAPGEGVIAVPTAHIEVHEAGAIEASGHKVILLRDSTGTVERHGLMTVVDLEQYLDDFTADPTREHRVQPGAVYITVPSELGTLYTAAEIEGIYNICQHYGLKLYTDGARLAYALASNECEYDLAWLAHHCDAMYIGGTKCGALMGEAAVFPRGDAPRAFFSTIKRHGALLAKSRLAGVQFDALFSDGLYERIGRHAVDLALELRSHFMSAGYEMYGASVTNQQFVVLPNAVISQLTERYIFEQWGPLDNERTVCRFVTSWSTTDEDVASLGADLARIVKA